LLRSTKATACVLALLAIGCERQSSDRNDADAPPAISAAAPPSSQSFALTKKWEYQGDEAFEATPAANSEVVIVGDVMGTLYAINRADGSERWTINYDTGFLAAPVIREDMVVVGDVMGVVYCLNVDDGSERWTAETDGEINGAPAFYHDHVLVASQDGKLYCFQIADGSLVWEYQTDDQIRCRPVIADNLTFLGGCDGRLHIVNLDTGEAAGDPLPLNGPTGSTPALRDSLAVVPIMDGVVYAFDWQDRELVWTHQDEERFQEYRNSPAIAGDLVIVASQFKQVDAISLETGERVWRHTLRRRADGSPVVAGDTLWIAATDGRLVALDAATGEPRPWSFESRGEFYAAPLIEGNDLIIADDNGVVRCFAGIESR